MAHALTQNKNGEYEMSYVGEKPWHGLGQQLQAIARADEILEAAHLNWMVEPHEVITADGIDCPNHRAIVREDTRKVLSVMTQHYVPIQNYEVAAFMEAVVGTGEAMFETAGSLFGGKKVFFCAKLPKQVKVNDGDVLDQYLCGCNGHDGTLGMKVFFTTIRVVCNNTLTAAVGSNPNAVTIYHIGDVYKRVKEAQDILGLAHQYFAEFEDIAKGLAEKVADKAMVEALIESTFQRNDKGEYSPVTQAYIDQLINNFENDPKNNMPGTKGSAWALLNATTQLADHGLKSTTAPDAERRMNSIFFGQSNELKRKATSKILQLTK